MRLIGNIYLRRMAAAALLVAGATCALLVPQVRAQNPSVMMPEQSAAKARELIQQAIQALGGDAFLQVRDSTCTGRLSSFGSQGDLNGYQQIWDFYILPEKNRTEYGKKRNIIEIYNGEQGWTLDRGGVEDMPVIQAQGNMENVSKNINHLFRKRLNEEGLVFRYGGTDIVDLKPMDWVEITDRQRKTTRIAFDRVNGLPARAVFITRDPETRERYEEVEFYSNYHAVAGVQTPLQVARLRNGRKVYQVFWESCQYNTGLPEEMFTRPGLEQTWLTLNKGKKPKAAQK